MQQRLLVNKGLSASANTIELLNDHPELKGIYLKLRTIEQLIKLLTHNPGSELDFESTSFENLISILDEANPVELRTSLFKLLDRSQQLLKDLDPFKATS